MSGAGAPLGRPEAVGASRLKRVEDARRAVHHAGRREALRVVRHEGRGGVAAGVVDLLVRCLLYTSPSPRDS